MGREHGHASRPPARRGPVSLALVAAIALVLVTLTLPVWKPYAKQWKWFVVSTNIYQDLLRRTGIKQDQIGQGSFERPLADIPAALSRIDDLFSGTLAHAGLSADDLRGRSVLEVGPGENIGLALRFVAAGATRVVSIDKFVPLQTSPYHQQLYRALREACTSDERARLDATIDLSRGVDLRADGPLRYVYGRGIEEAQDLLGRNSFDLITSNKIDLSDYGMFIKHGFHPLEFLTIPDPIYRLMVESTGQPNRRRIDYYRAKGAEFGYDTRIATTTIVGRHGEFVPPREELHPGEEYTDATIEALQEIRPRLLDRYQQLSDRDLMVQGIVYVARKPSARVHR